MCDSKTKYQETRCKITSYKEKYDPSHLEQNGSHFIHPKELKKADLDKMDSIYCSQPKTNRFQQISFPLIKHDLYLKYSYLQNTNNKNSTIYT